MGWPVFGTLIVHLVWGGCGVGSCVDTIESMGSKGTQILQCWPGGKATISGMGVDLRNELVDLRGSCYLKNGAPHCRSQGKFKGRQRSGLANNREKGDNRIIK